ncbi:copper chaperone PCu(A)C [Paralcaligenes sp. KSB-10]|jgi:copper(I)-binding protein|uniref:copper chaperone PCu(A)C n=1 Tax=Paralcaligenes sp. KSB-10 TaxID=2901142 RepID=UPI001E35C703|nr:copper chaperone PCu(A)C [Paralcaligenes sp. KSB-10]UHL64585.1 copper chaperone PCu(A)C [Paralcaligenes sp. KSB-10]
MLNQLDAVSITQAIISSRTINHLSMVLQIDQRHQADQSAVQDFFGKSVMSLSKLFTIGAIALLACGSVHAQEYKAGGLQIEHPWARASAPQQSMGAGYMLIKNTGNADDRLLSISSNAANMTEVHQVTSENNMVKMGPVDSLPIPKGKTVQLAPNGYHVMFMNIKAPFKQGEKIPATLTFEKAGKVQIEFQVEPLTYQPGQAHGEPMHMNMDTMHHQHAK